ncbi:SulP family inorganic anion transporter [Bremerella sp.]|uniref:SulP family inorganic anion transporter n=1 Tax=Bremerella sp. TaxID=2795602 RepID=UPI00391C40D7
MPNDKLAGDVPRGDSAGFIKYFPNDFKSGFLVFLIALPLCLGISLACGFPPIAGIFTAIIGAVLSPFISNSELTIKGPAAGLIVIAIGCVQDFGGDGMTGGWTESDMAAYRAAIAVGVAAGAIQIVFGLFRGGILGEFFPASVVHGMLAAIGVIIIVKQIPFALGVSAGGEPLEMLREIPHYLMEANPAIAAIGVVSLLIMFLWPLLAERVTVLKKIPAPVVVLLCAIPMGMAFDLLHEHSYTLQGHKYQLSEQYLVKMPDKVFGMFNDIAFPEFSVLGQPKAWKWILMFFIIGSLESVLSAKAIDLLDPWKRKTKMNRDLIAIGVGNLCASMVGGLPMISEIVRSKANIDNGAKTRFANFWHGVFLLACVALIPFYLHRIPLAALAAMLIYTGYRLAHPNEFIHVYRIGKEQLAIFVTTLVVVLATDLLVGVAVGIMLKMVIHLANGVSLRSLFKPYIEVQEINDNTSVILARESAVFSNWLPFRRQIEQIGLIQKRNLVIDVSGTKLIDHSVMEKLEEVQRDFEQEGLTFEIRGLNLLESFSDNVYATRKRRPRMMRRVALTLESERIAQVEARLSEFGASIFSSVPCSSSEVNSLIRIELICSQKTCESLLEYVRQEVLTEPNVHACVDSIEIIQRESRDA